MSLTKDTIIEILQQKMGNMYSRVESVRHIETLIEIIKRDLEKGEEVLISGFGKFCIKEKAPRKGRNPATGEDMMLDKRRVVTFHCSEKLRNKINEKK
jgi:integration host factor subunit alpha